MDNIELLNNLHNDITILAFKYGGSAYGAKIIGETQSLIDAQIKQLTNKI